MAKTLWLLRHGDAQEARTSDFDRPLTQRGERQARNVGRAFARLGVELEHALTSPRVRALDTARIACRELGIEPVVYAPLGGDFSLDSALELVAAGSEDGAQLLVGHEPDFSRLIGDLTGAHVAMKKGGLAAIRLGGGHGELLALLRPREIELVAGH